jgi:hypothetical protein
MWSPQLTYNKHMRTTYKSTYVAWISRLDCNFIQYIQHCKFAMQPRIKILDMIKTIFFCVPLNAWLPNMQDTSKGITGVKNHRLVKKSIVIYPPSISSICDLTNLIRFLCHCILTHVASLLYSLVMNFSSSHLWVLAQSSPRFLYCFNVLILLESVNEYRYF